MGRRYGAIKPDDKLTIPVFPAMKDAIMRAAYAADMTTCAWVRVVIEQQLFKNGVERTWPEYSHYASGRKERSDKGTTKSD